MIKKMIKKAKNVLAFYNPIFDSIKAENPANMGFFRFFQYFKM